MDLIRIDFRNVCSRVTDFTNDFLLNVNNNIMPHVRSFVRKIVFCYYSCRHVRPLSLSSPISAPVPSSVAPDQRFRSGLLYGVGTPLTPATAVCLPATGRRCVLARLITVDTNGVCVWRSMGVDECTVCKPTQRCERAAATCDTEEAAPT